MQENNDLNKVICSDSLLNKITTYLYPILVLALSILYFFLGFWLENGQINFHEIIFGQVYTKYNYTLGQSLLDVDQFLGEFINTLIFCLIILSVFLIYGIDDNEVSMMKDSKRIINRLKIYGGLSLSIFVIAIVLSLWGIKLRRPEWDGRTFQLIFGNFYDGYFSIMIFPLVLILGGLVAFPYVLANAGRKELEGWSPNKLGFYVLLVVMGIVEILIITMPIIPEEMFKADIVRVFLYRSLDVLLITGIILNIEFKNRKEMEALEKPNVEENSSDNSNKRENKDAGANKKDKSEENNEERKEKLKFNLQDLKLSRYQKHAIIWLIFFFVTPVLIAITYYIAVGNIPSEIGIGKFISRVWIVAFEICFVLFLYYLSVYYRKIKIMEGL
ncbi:MAG: hypothetical protein ACTSU2_12805 [Promethearchaeota archaeon]